MVAIALGACSLASTNLVVAQAPGAGRSGFPGWSRGIAEGQIQSDPVVGDNASIGPSPDNDVRNQIGLAPLPAESELRLLAPLPDDRNPPVGQPGVVQSRLGQFGDHRNIDRQATVDSTYTSAEPRTRRDIQSVQDLESLSTLLEDQAGSLTSREGLGSSIKVALLLAVLSLAPAIVLMTTCYVRVVVVLTLLRQAFGSQQLPPTQVLTALSLFLTLLVMAPVWNQVKTEAIDPYTRESEPITWEEAWERGTVPVKTFMTKQIVAAGNTDSVAMFYQYLPAQTETAVSEHPSQPQTADLPEDIQDVPISVLLPAFLISELKVAFLLGFQIYLPFLVLDLVVSSVTVSTGMLMLPPTMVSFPLKLILFVMVDGWNLVIGMLLQSFAPFT